MFGQFVHVVVDTIVDLCTRPDTDESFNLDVNALQASVPDNEDVVFGITVGSETLYRGNFTGEQLLTKIQTVQNMFPGVLIGTADSWNMYTEGKADALITGNVTLLWVHSAVQFEDKLTISSVLGTLSPTGKVKISAMRLPRTLTICSKRSGISKKRAEAWMQSAS